MRLTGSPLRRRPSPATAVVVSIALALVGNLATNTVEVKDRWWPWAIWSAVVLLVATAVALEGIRWSADRATAPSGVGLQDLAQRLAGAVKSQWVQEAALHQVQPVPLRVRWSSTRRPVAAGRDVVLDEPAGNDWHELPLHGDVRQLLVAFKALPHRQLVVLGEPGAGKSVLATLLTLELIKQRASDDPVPVMFTIASWNPAVEHIDEFLARRTREEYGFLAEVLPDGRTLADLLIAEGMVFPILDGLDEIPSDLYATAIRVLDRLGIADRPLVLTCRSREYEQAVTDSGALLSRAAVVEIEPVDSEQVIAFLSHPATSRYRWQPVLEHLRDEPQSPLAQVLSTPLMVVLARVAYRNPRTEPRCLLEVQDHAAIKGQLIQAYVSAAYQTDPPSSTHDDRVLMRSYKPLHAERWLSFLAHHLYCVGSRDLWWWQLASGSLSSRLGRKVSSAAAMGPVVVRILGIRPGTRWWRSLMLHNRNRRPPRTRLILLAVLTIGAALLVGLGASIASSVGIGLRAWVAAAGIMAMSSIGVFQPLWPDGHPPYVVFRYRTPRQHSLGRIAVAAAFGLLPGMITGLLLADPLLGGVAGTVCGLFTMMKVAWLPPGRSRASTPQTTLRAAHQRALIASIQHGSVGAAAFAALTRLVPGQSGSIQAGGVAALVYGTFAALSAGEATWLLFRATHLLAAVRGRLPWRLERFLTDAHRRGVLRQAGSSWQFRHALLQDHLADALILEDLTARANAGDIAAEKRMVDLLTIRGRTNEAISLLQVRADGGDRQAADRLVDMLANHGRVNDLRCLANSGNHRAVGWIANLLAGQGQVEDAIAILRPSADAHDHYAAYRLADLLHDHGYVDELQRRFEAGDPQAAVRFVALLVKQNRVEDAMQILQQQAAAGDRVASERLVDLSVASGQVEEALMILRIRADEGDWDATTRLLHLLVSHEYLDELRTRANAGDTRAASRFIELLKRKGRVEEAIAFLRARLAVNNLTYMDRASASTQMAELLAETGRVEELQTLVDAGNTHAVHQMVDVLTEQGRIEEAVATLRPHADNDAEGWTSMRLADLLASNGRLVELRARADAGDRFAISALIRALYEAGNVNELRRWAETGEGSAAVWLARLLTEQGDISEALEILRPHADAGDWQAVFELVELLVQLGHVDHAVAMLRTRADAGDRYAVQRLTALLAE